VDWTTVAGSSVGAAALRYVSRSILEEYAVLEEE